MLFKELTELTNIGILKTKQTQTLLLINGLITGITFALFLILSLDSIWLMVLLLAGSQMVRFLVVTLCSQRSEKLPYQVAPLAFIVLATTASLLANAYMTNPVWMLPITVSAFIFIATTAYYGRILPYYKPVTHSIGSKT